jgi:hypothetical protein
VPLLHQAEAAVPAARSRAELRGTDSGRAMDAGAGRSMGPASWMSFRRRGGRGLFGRRLRGMWAAQGAGCTRPPRSRVASESSRPAVRSRARASASATCVRGRAVDKPCDGAAGRRAEGAGAAGWLSPSLTRLSGRATPWADAGARARPGARSGGRPRRCACAGGPARVLGCPGGGGRGPRLGRWGWEGAWRSVVEAVPARVGAGTVRCC